MPVAKPTILLCWGYHRKGWIEPFEKLNHSFDFVYLYYATQPDNEVRCTENKVIYWGDYSSPFDLLEEIKPVKVVFMGIYSAYPIALNIACKKKSIITCVYQHGLFQDYKVYRLAEKLHKKHNKHERELNSQEGPKTLPPKANVLTFLKNSLGFSDMFQLPLLFLYLFLQRREGEYFASRHIRFSSRMPDLYICYTKRNATIYLETDNPPPHKLLFVGPPEYDKFFRDGSPDQASISGKYYLLIDRPLAGSQFHSLGISREQVNDFYLKLATFCRSKGAKLVIKLHPESYSNSWHIQDEAILYVKDEYDHVSIIRNCEGCFGVFSTLLIPAIYFKPCILFKLLDASLQKHLINLGVAAGLDFYAFTPEEIDFAKVKMPGSENPQFVEDYIYKPDGKSVDRLRQVLES